jgi:hypothetical protein
MIEHNDWPWSESRTPIFVILPYVMVAILHLELTSSTVERCAYVLEFTRIQAFAYAVYIGHNERRSIAAGYRINLKKCKVAEAQILACQIEPFWFAPNKFLFIPWAHLRQLPLPPHTPPSHFYYLLRMAIPVNNDSSAPLSSRPQDVGVLAMETYFPRRVSNWSVA